LYGSVKYPEKSKLIFSSKTFARNTENRESERHR